MAKWRRSEKSIVSINGQRHGVTGETSYHDQRSSSESSVTACTAAAASKCKAGGVIAISRNIIWRKYQLAAIMAMASPVRKQHRLSGVTKKRRNQHNVRINQRKA